MPISPLCLLIAAGSFPPNLFHDRSLVSRYEGVYIGGLVVPVTICVTTDEPLDAFVSVHIQGQEGLLEATSSDLVGGCQ